MIFQVFDHRIQNNIHGQGGALPRVISRRLGTMPWGEKKKKYVDLIKSVNRNVSARNEIPVLER